MLRDAAGKHGEKAAIVSVDSSLTYSELDTASGRFAARLAEWGVGRGDRVAVMLPNSPELAVAFFGAVKLGAAAVLLDSSYKPGELASFFKDSGAAFFISAIFRIYRPCRICRSSRKRRFS
jgi:long-chain acyl-CoA synthetase